MKKRGLIFSLAYFPHLVGGAEIAIKEITDRISPEEIEFDMITLFAGNSRYERIGNVNVYRVGPNIEIKGNSVPHISYLIKFQYVLFAFLKALRLNRKNKYDFIWSVMASFNGFSALFFKFLHKDIPFLLTLQEGDSIKHIRKSVGIMYPLYLKIFRKADFIQAISIFLANYGKNLGAKCPITVVPNGVDIKLFSKSPPQGHRSALLDELGLSTFDTIVITTSRLVAKNAVGDIIDSLSYLPPEVKLIIVGTGPQESLLKEKTRLLKLEDRIRFVGFVPHNEIPLYLSISNIFVRPSLSEGLGISFLEAMSAGLPVIATPVGGITDFLIDEKTGLFCEVENPKNLSEKIEILMKNNELRESISKSAREMVAERYEWSEISSKMLDIFQNLK